MENKKYNKLFITVVLICVIIFISFGTYRANEKMEERQLRKDYEAMLNQVVVTPIVEAEITATPTPTETPEDTLITENNGIDLTKITNYPINELTYNLNGANCTLPFTVQSMVSYGYLFQDKISSDNYTYNQLSEVVAGNSYSSFVDTLSPNNQIVSILIKNNDSAEQMMMNCDVYGISAKTTYYGISETEPTFELSNGLYLGMSEGDLIKTMGNYDKLFYVDEERTIVRYQWYQSLDGTTIDNILTCDIINGYVHMISVEIA